MNSELQLSIIRAVRAQPGLLLLNRGLTPDSFTKGQARDTFEAIGDIYRERKCEEIDPVLLAERIGGNGAFGFVSNLLSETLSEDIRFFPSRVLELQRRQLSAKIRSLLCAQESSPELELDDEIRRALKELDALAVGAQDPSRALRTGAELQALDLKTEYVVDKLAPCRSLVLIHGPGGLAKTWLALCIARAVSEGQPLLGLGVSQRPVTYIDYENPLPMLVDRLRKLDINEAQFWHLSADPRPPKLDSDDWISLKSLPPGLMIFDTARSSFDGDENSSQDVGLVMGRLKEIRELGNTIILLHHTPRANERASKGSTAWEDLSDHVLSFYKCKRETHEETDEEIPFDPSALLSLGTGRKTRYEPFRIYLTLDPEDGGFRLERGPNADAIDLIAAYIAGEGRGQNQGQIVEWAKRNEVGPKNKQSFIRLLGQGEREKHWQSYQGMKNARFYVPRG